jgi:hypothetical protein
MDHQAYAFLDQQGPVHPSYGVQILRFSVGWAIDDDTVFLYGLSNGYVYCGSVSHPQAVEFFTFGLQLN